ncbi:hypothetical protein CKO51_08985 [Rhodopirellula sp. SM50]|nr:DUF2007 domain-containing protein [Rhodopirellula sp. SM50]PAY19842.1 hypothetical protein CKO51_08985 [Rhodopirellula sp. SM50]
MRTLQIFSNAVEAEILRARLDAAGIFAVVNGGEVATMLSHIGSAVVRVRVEVAPEDFERAKEILETDEIERSERTAWQCSRCDERNEPLFDLCWSCGKTRDESDLSRPLLEFELPVIRESGPMVVADQPPRKPVSSNPYAPVLIPNEDCGPRSESDQAEQDSRDAELVARIFRGAVIGIFILPPLLTFYVLFLLVFEVPRAAYRDPRLYWRLLASWFLCLIAIGFAAVVWSRFF